MCVFLSPRFPSKAGRAQTGGAAGPSPAPGTRWWPQEGQGGGRASGAAAPPGQRLLRPPCHLSGLGAACPEQPPRRSPAARGGPRCAGRAGAGGWAGTARRQPSPPSLRPSEGSEPQLTLRASPSSPPRLGLTRIPRVTAALPAGERLGFELPCEKEKYSLFFFLSPASCCRLAGWGPTVWWWWFLFAFRLRLAEIPT